MTYPYDDDVADQEFANEHLCITIAINNGHTKNQAMNCDAGSVKYPNCPWEDKSSIDDWISANLPEINE